MQHDFSICFDTESEYWQRVLDIFAKNEKYEKKIVEHRNLHHKFPRSFSKSLCEEVDNDEDNLISLSLADHFLVHYYYYLLAKKGYKQPMALAFMMMAKKGMKYITPETAEAMAKDYEEAVEISKQVFQTDEFRKKMSEALKGKPGHPQSEETRQKLSEAKKGKPLSDETRKKIAEANKRRVYSKKTRKKMSDSLKGRKFSDDTRKKMAAAQKGRKYSDEHRKNMSEAIKSLWARRRSHQEG